MDTAILIAIIGSGSLSAIVTAAINAMQNRGKKKSAERTALMCLLDDKLGYLTEKYITRGSITFDERRRIVEIHRAYKALGGNGYYNELMQRVDALPISN